MNRRNFLKSVIAVSVVPVAFVNNKTSLREVTISKEFAGDSFCAGNIIYIQGSIGGKNNGRYQISSIVDSNIECTGDFII